MAGEKLLAATAGMPCAADPVRCRVNPWRPHASEGCHYGHRVVRSCAPGARRNGDQWGSGQ